MSNPKNAKRNERVSEAIHRELAALLRSEVKDPRLKALTVMQVDVTPDLAHAKIFVAHPEGEMAWPDVQRALRSATGFMRSKVAKVLNTYTVPTLNFVYDASPERGQHLTSLIDQALMEDRAHPVDETVPDGNSAGRASNP